MNTAFPDAEVTGFALPDKDDNHVLAAAIRSNADVIITFNLSDFPNDYLSQYDIEAQHPDHFIYSLIDLNQTKAVNAFQKQVKRLKQPKKTEKQVAAIIASGTFNLNSFLISIESFTKRYVILNLFQDL